VRCGNQNKMDDTKTHTVTIRTKYGKRGETGNLKKLALEVEHEIEREFI
jgi:hypothetical protein